MFDDADTRSQTAGGDQETSTSGAPTEDLAPLPPAIARDWLHEQLRLTIAQHRELRRSFVLISLTLDRGAVSIPECGQAITAAMTRLRRGLRRRDRVILLKAETLLVLLEGIVGDAPMPRLLERVRKLALSVEAEGVETPLALALDGIRYPTDGYRANTLLDQLERKRSAV